MLQEVTYLVNLAVEGARGVVALDESVSVALDKLSSDDNDNDAPALQALAAKVGRPPRAIDPPLQGPPRFRLPGGIAALERVVRRPVQLSRILHTTADLRVILLPRWEGGHYALVAADVIERCLYAYEGSGKCPYQFLQKVRSCVHATPSGRVEARVAVEAHTPR